MCWAQASDQFHVLGLVKRCCDFLISGLDWDNCIGIRNFARAFFCGVLDRTANRFIMEHFTEIAQKSNELLMLSDAEMVRASTRPTRPIAQPN